MSQLMGFLLDGLPKPLHAGLCLDDTPPEDEVVVVVLIGEFHIELDFCFSLYHVMVEVAVFVRMRR